MPYEPNVQRILDYLHQHRDQYGVEALRQHLLVVGYTPDDVTAAIDRLLEQPAPTAASDVDVPEAKTNVQQPVRSNPLPVQPAAVAGRRTDSLRLTGRAATILTTLGWPWGPALAVVNVAVALLLNTFAARMLSFVGSGASSMFARLAGTLMLIGVGEFFASGFVLPSILHYLPVSQALWSWAPRMPWYVNRAVARPRNPVYTGALLCGGLSAIAIAGVLTLLWLMYRTRS